MTRSLKILAAQLNPIVGDISGNQEMARRAHIEASRVGADLLVFPELFIMGYPPEDLVLKPSAVDMCRLAIEALAPITEDGPAILIGTPWKEGRDLFNSVILMQSGKIIGRYDKYELPNYGVFDEVRLFTGGTTPGSVFCISGVNVGVAICEDLWYRRVPSALKDAGAELIVAPNASPWRRTIQAERAQAFDAWADLQLPYLFVNQVGGQDELVFDGASYATNGLFAERCQFGDEFRPGTACVTFSEGRFQHAPDTGTDNMDPCEADYRATVLALSDYVTKNGFPGVVLGLSGGIDSALTAAIAVDALGPERVWCVMMPSKYTSTESLEDARDCAEKLGVRYDTLHIEAGVNAVGQMLTPIFESTKPDTTEENIQSRLRGLTLMALSNKFGYMVVTTGNKSEMAVGYATLYGDMCGGYNALKDFYKTEVVSLSRWRNHHHPEGVLGPAGTVIPDRIITKPPSAELREDQKDEDSLPSYEVLDDILRGLVDHEEDVGDIVARGHDESVVRRIEHLLYVAEYKRRQAPPGVKIGPRNFGRDRRYPITNRFRDD